MSKAYLFHLSLTLQYVNIKQIQTNVWEDLSSFAICWKLLFDATQLELVFVSTKLIQFS